MDEYFINQPQENKFFLILKTDTGTEQSYTHQITKNPNDFEGKLKFKGWANTIPIFVEIENNCPPGGKLIQYQPKTRLKLKF